MRTLTRILICLFAALTINCSEEEKLHERPFPRLKTNDVEEISSAGAVLSGTITFTPGEISDHGFLVDITSNFSSSQGKKYSAGPFSGTGDFQLAIDTELREGTTYYVRAYAVYGDYTSNGDVKEFVSLGSKAPVVKSFSPQTGTWNDKVVIYGENFGTILANARVKFDENLATVLSTSRDSLVCRVPSSLAVSPSTVQVSVSGNASNVLGDFTLLSPEITGIAPAEGNIGTTVTIEGKNFNPNKTRLFIGDLQIVPTQVITTKITFTVSHQFPLGESLVKVFNAEGNGFATTGFNYTGSKVLSVEPLTGTYEDVVEITVENWLPQLTPTVYVGEHYAQVLSFENDVIRFAIPPDMVSYSGEVIVKAGIYDFPTGKYFTLLPPIVYSITPEMLLGPGSVQIVGERFSSYYTEVMVGGNSTGSSVWEDDLIEVSVSSSDSHLVDVEVTCSGQTTKANTQLRFPLIRLNYDYIEANYVHESVSSDSHVFLWKYDGLSGIDFLEFDRSDKSWDEKTAPPFSTMDNSGTAFLIGHDVYVYLAYDNTMWKYNALTNSWIERSNPPFALFYAESFSALGRGYLAGGVDQATWESNKKTWEYDPATDQWTEKASVTGTLQMVKGFMVGNTYHCLTENGYVAKYDPALDDWTITSSNVGWTLGCLGEMGGEAYFVSYDYKLISYSLATGQLKGYEGQLPFGEIIYSENVAYIVNGATYEFDPSFL
jgi:hypothetical protein